MIVGTRHSKLALAQTYQFRDRITAAFPGIECTIKEVTSTGDIDLKSSLKDMGGTGVFVRELDAMLKDGTVDVTVNSLKDIPVKIDPALTVAAVLPRAAVEDAVIPVPWDSLKPGCVLGTSSVRRSVLIGRDKPDVKLKDIRGNMNTRLAKLEAGEYDAIIMAKAGLDRLGITENVHPVDKHILIPAAGQGAIAVECRADDEETISLLKALDHPKTRTEVTFERDVLRFMNAGCSSPIGVNAELVGDRLNVIAVSFVPEEPVSIETSFPASEAFERAREIADVLLRK